MKGIADGAAAAGAKFDSRPIDLLDVVTLNADVETNFLDNALEATATCMTDALVADMIAIVGSLDTVMGEVDR